MMDVLVSAAGASGKLFVGMVSKFWKSDDDGDDKCENYDTHLKLPAEIGTDYNYKRRIVWVNAVGFLALHLAALYGYYRCLFAHPFTIFWSKYMSQVFDSRISHKFVFERGGSF